MLTVRLGVAPGGDRIVVPRTLGTAVKPLRATPSLGAISGDERSLSAPRQEEDPVGTETDDSYPSAWTPRHIRERARSAFEAASAEGLARKEDDPMSTETEQTVDDSYPSAWTPRHIRERDEVPSSAEGLTQRRGC